VPETTVSGVRLYYELAGDGPHVLVLVHGGWGDHHSWDAVVPGLARSCRVLTYDRRGHSRSERLPTSASIVEHVSDLASLIRHLNLAPAHIVGNSYGASIVLKLATRHPELFVTLSVHEPPLIGLLDGNPVATVVRERLGAVVARIQSGDVEDGARQFFDTVAFGPGSWEKLSDDARRKIIFNAPTYLDEFNEPDPFMLDVAELSRFDRPVLLTEGDQSLPCFGPILETIAAALPAATRCTFHGAGHVPQLTHPEQFVRLISDFMHNQPT
jgi:pimeloyl-ACP methyl ester carboxylesterase